MATEKIIVNGEEVAALKELLRPGLKAEFVGLNPAKESVDKGHYYQGHLGSRFWKRLRECNVVSPLPDGMEDDAAFAHGYGFADLVRRPTRSGKELSCDQDFS